MPRTQSSKSTQTLPAIKPSFPNPMSSVAAYPPSVSSNFGQVVKEGFAFGTGSAIAHRIFGPGIPFSSPKPMSGTLCDKERLAFESCLKTKSAEDFCGNEQLAYATCVQLKKE